MNQAEREDSDRRFSLKLILIIDAFLVILGFLAYFMDSFKLAIVPIAGAPMFIIITIGVLFKEINIAHRAQYRELEPLSYYGSVKHQARAFLKLAVPFDLKGEKDSFANQCIETYAENGEISLTEEERARLSLVVLETGISSQEPGEKNYWERERVAIIENILSEKYKQ